MERCNVVCGVSKCCRPWIQRQSSIPWVAQPRCAFIRSSRTRAVSQEDAYTRLLGAIEGVTGRGQGGLDTEQLKDFQSAVDELENARGIEDPVLSDKLLGRWKLLYTSTPGTESPVQRTFTGVDMFQVFQDIVRDDSGVRVRNVVRFGDQIGSLRVEAEGNTDAQPIKGFVPRQSEGLALFGKSLIAAPDRKNKRIDFWFDQAAFNFGFLPFKVPYPVPFKLFGDETKGWLDITYLDPQGGFRISRGNKGTIFVLEKVERTTKEMLLDAIAEGAGDKEILDLVDEMKELNPTPNIATNEKLIGKWRQIWSRLGDVANPVEKSVAGLGQWQQVMDDSAENLVSLIPGLVSLRFQASTKPLSDMKTKVKVKDVAFEIPGRKFPVDSSKRNTEFLDWIYLDDDLRIATGSNQSCFVHVKDS